MEKLQELKPVSFFDTDTNREFNTKSQDPVAVGYLRDVSALNQSRSKYFGMQPTEYDTSFMNTKALARSGVGIALGVKDFGQRFYYEEKAEWLAKLTDTPVDYTPVEENMALIKESNATFMENLGIAPVGAEGFIADVVGGAGSLATAIGLTVVSKNPTLATAVFGVTATEDIQTELQDVEGADYERSRNLARGAGLAVASLEKIGLDNMFMAFKGNTVISSAVRGLVTEGTQEGLQQVAQDTALKVGGKEMTVGEIVENATYSALIGSILGSTTAGTVMGANKFFTRQQELAMEQANIDVNEVKEAVKQTAEKAIVNQEIVNETGKILQRENSNATYQGGDILQAVDYFKRVREDENIVNSLKNVEKTVTERVLAGGGTQEEAQVISAMAQSFAVQAQEDLEMTPEEIQDRLFNIERMDARQEQVSDEDFNIVSGLIQEQEDRTPTVDEVNEAWVDIREQKEQENLDNEIANLPEYIAEEDGTVTEPDPEPAPEPETDQVTDQVSDQVTDQVEKPKKKTKTQQKIEDFGEKIGGAKKDIAQNFINKLNLYKTDQDIMGNPLSKTLPLPNFEKLSEQGFSNRQLALVNIIRSLLPKKPTRLSRYYADRWLNEFKATRNTIENLLSKKLEDNELNSEIEMFTPEFQERINLFLNASEQLDPKYYKDIKDIVPSTRTSGSGKLLVTKNNKSVFNDQYDYIGFTKDSQQELLDYLRSIVTDKESKKGKPKKRYRFDLYRDRKTDEVFIGAKRGRNVLRIKTGFKELKDAKLYLSDNYDDLVNIMQEMTADPVTRGESNRARIGKEHINTDVTPEIFSDTFKFRGVEFGNWVEGTKRQKDLNEAFDGLMDLADVLDVKPSTLSLGGNLGLAFGARGTKGAKAHFERDFNVINLTKKDGAGTLAHEWFHALDFSLSEGMKMTSEKSKYLTNPENITRQEVLDAFQDVIKSFKGTDFEEQSEIKDKTRAKPYWSTDVEMFARSFEMYVRDKLAENNTQNDYLVNLAQEYGGVYPSKEDMEKLTPEFDKLFNTLDVRVSDKGVEEFYQTTQVSTDEFRQLMQEKYGAKVGIYGDGNIVTLSNITIPEDQRNAGIGSSIMREMISWADVNNKTIALTPSADFGSSVPRLKEFYKTFGFVENKGRNKDFEISEDMYREPKELLQGKRGSYNRATNYVKLFEDADRSTILHESSHWFLSQMEDINSLYFDKYGSNMPMYNTIVEYLGDPEFGSFTVNQQEQFAQGFEQFVLEGKVDNTRLAKAFEMLAKWLKDIYRRVTGVGVKLNKQARDLYNDILSSPYINEQEFYQDLSEKAKAIQDKIKNNETVSQEEIDELKSMYKEYQSFYKQRRQLEREDEFINIVNSKGGYSAETGRNIGLEGEVFNTGSERTVRDLIEDYSDFTGETVDFNNPAEVEDITQRAVDYIEDIVEYTEKTDAMEENIQSIDETFNFLDQQEDLDLKDMVQPVEDKSKLNNIYQDNLQTKQYVDSGNTLFNNGKNSMIKAKNGLTSIYDTVFMPIESIAFNISPELFKKMREHSFAVHRMQGKDNKIIKPFLEKTRNIPEKDLATLDLALKNRDNETVDALASKHNISKELAEVRTLLDEIYASAQDAGIELGYLDNYFPRMFKNGDVESLLNMIEMRKNQEQYDIADLKLNEQDAKYTNLWKELQAHPEWTSEQKAQFVNMNIRGFSGNQIFLSSIGNLKHERTIDLVDAEMNQFYMPFTEALVTYVSSARDNIANKKFFGAETKEVKKIRANVKRNQTEIKKLEQGIQDLRQGKQISTDDTIKTLSEKIAKKQAKVNQLNSELAKVKDNTLEESIGNLVADMVEDGVIYAKDQKLVKDVLKAKFDQQGIGKWGVVRDAGYIATLNDFANTLTQFGDLALSAYKNGAFNAIAGITNKDHKKITKEDLGIDKMLAEFGTERNVLSKWLETQFKFIGFDMVDSLGKNSIINGSILKNKELLKKDPQELDKKLQFWFKDQEQRNQVKLDLAKDNISDDVIFLAFNDLADLQPISSDQLPIAYSKGGLYRLMYSLKTYTLKMLDILRKDVFKEMATNPKKALKNLVMLQAMVLMFGVPKDLVKNLLTGEDEELGETFGNNFILYTILSKYSLTKYFGKGYDNTTTDLVLNLTKPPVWDIGKSIERDVSKVAKGKKDIDEVYSVRYVPYIGEGYYWWFGKGAERKKD